MNNFFYPLVYLSKLPVIETSFQYTITPDEIDYCLPLFGLHRLNALILNTTLNNRIFVQCSVWLWRRSTTYNQIWNKSITLPDYFTLHENKYYRYLASNNVQSRWNIEAFTCWFIWKKRYLWWKRRLNDYDNEDISITVIMSISEDESKTSEWTDEYSYVLWID